MAVNYTFGELGEITLCNVKVYVCSCFVFLLREEGKGYTTRCVGVPYCSKFSCHSELVVEHLEVVVENG